MHRALVFLLLACLAPLGVAESAPADTAPAAESALPDDQTSALFAPEPASSSSTSVTVIKADELQHGFVRSLEDLRFVAPGLIVDPLAGSPQGATVAIRGIGSREVGEGFEAAVAIVVDGVQIGGHSGAMHVLFDFDQVEVVRGPQGMLLGPSSLGGAIVVRRTPPKGELDVHLRASAGTFDRRVFDAVVHAPRFRGVSTKLAASWMRGGGDEVRNVFANRPENDLNRLFVSASPHFRPIDSVEVLYTFDVDSDKSDTPGLLNISAAGTIGNEGDVLCVRLGRCAAGETSLLTPESGTYTRTLQNFDNSSEFEAETQTLRATYAGPRYEVTSLTGVRSTSALVHQDLDGTAVDFYSLTRDNEYDQFSQEVRVTTEAFNGTQVVAGFYYLDTESSTHLVEHFITDQLAQAGLFTLPTPGTAGDLTTRSNFDSKKLAVFAHLERRFGERWTVDGGVRWHDVDIKSRLVTGRLDSVTVSGAPRFTVPARLDGRMDFDNAFGTIGIRYRVDDSAILFLRGAQGHRNGGFDASARTTAAYVPFSNEATNSYEVGLKSDWWEDKLRVNVVAYRTWLKDQSGHVREAVRPRRQGECS